jgi:hypothetical protein
MNVTVSYSTVHRALSDTAQAHQLVPMEVRVLLALADRGGESRTDELERDLCVRGGTAIRRCLLTLRPLGMVKGGDMRGQRSPVMLAGGASAVLEDFRRMLVEIQADGLDQELRSDRQHDWR